MCKTDNKLSLSLTLLKCMADKELLIRTDVSNPAWIIRRYIKIIISNLEILKLENKALYNSLNLGLTIFVEDEENDTPNIETTLEFKDGFNIERDIDITYHDQELEIVLIKNNSIKNITQIDINKISGIQLILE